MWNPAPRWQQQGSFVQPVTPPDAEICDPPVACITVNMQWLAVLAGAAMQLVQPTTWLVSSPSQLDTALGRATDLIAEIGNAVPCQSPPPTLPGSTTGSTACNIAGYLANAVIRESMRRAIANIQAGQTVLGFGIAIIGAIPGGAGVFAFLIAALNGLYNAMESGTLSDYQDAVADDTLFGKVACAIYSAIELDGGVTDANFPSLVSNVGAVSYAHSDVIAAMTDYLNSLGASGLQGLQSPGVLAAYDCSGCGGGGAASGPGGLPPVRQSGKISLTIPAGSGGIGGAFEYPLPFPSGPDVRVSCDNPDLIAGIESVSATGAVATITAADDVAADTTATVYWFASLEGEI